MNELTRQVVLDDLSEEQSALMKFLSALSDTEWRTLARDDGWSVHDIAAHIADAHLTTMALSNTLPHLAPGIVGVTLPILPNGRVNTERLNMMRYEINRGLSRDEVMKRLSRGFALITKTVKTLDDDVLAAPGPYGPSGTMLEWFNTTVSHCREHRLQLEHVYATHA